MCCQISQNTHNFRNPEKFSAQAYTYNFTALTILMWAFTVIYILIAVEKRTPEVGNSVQYTQILANQDELFEKYYPAGCMWRSDESDSTNLTDIIEFDLWSYYEIWFTSSSVLIFEYLDDFFLNIVQQYLSYNGFSH